MAVTEGWLATDTADARVLIGGVMVFIIHDLRCVGSLSPQTLVALAIELMQ